MNIIAAMGGFLLCGFLIGLEVGTRMMERNVLAAINATRVRMEDSGK